jgi:excisionase family DNA binding protein
VLVVRLTVPEETVGCVLDSTTPHTVSMSTGSRRKIPLDASRDRANGLATLLDVEGVAAVLGVSVRHVRRLVAERRIPFIKWGRYLRFDPDDVAAWLEDARVDSFDPRTSVRRRSAG